MTEDLTLERPVVLLVEDDEDQLSWRRDRFADSGCMPIAVSSHDDAVRELRAGPAVDLVLTDIRLVPEAESGDEGKELDRSGLALARYVKETYVDLPVAGVSAYFDDEDLAEDEAFYNYFVQIWTKGQQDYRQLDEMIGDCRRMALKHRQSRRTNAFEVHAALRRRHEVRHPEVELMRELHPPAEAAPVEAVLRDAGYRLKLVEDRSLKLAQPIIVWLLDVDGRVDAEVYGQPALYARGATDEEAIVALIHLMDLYRAELASDSPDERVEPSPSLATFLRRTLGSRESESEGDGDGRSTG